MDPTPRPKLDALTGLRYLAALSVLVAHMAHNLPPELKVKAYLSELWSLGMPLFFTLSGFLMAYNYSAAFRARFGRTAWGFYVARFARIYPVYLVCLVLHLSFTGNFFHDLRDRTADTAKSFRYVLTVTQSWAHSPVFTDSHAPRPLAQSFMGVAWSVSTEAFFYAMFPLVVIPIARLVTGRGRMLAGAAVVYAAYLAAGYLIYRRVPPEAMPVQMSGLGRLYWLSYLAPYMRFGEFLIGAVAGQYFLRAGETPAGSRRWWAGAAVLAGSVAVLAAAYCRVWLPQVYGAAGAPRWVVLAAHNVLYAPLCAAIIYQLAALPCLARRVIGCPLMVLLGEMSYCMYLLHPLAQSWYFPRATGEGPMKDWYVVAYNNLAMVLMLHFLCLGMYRYWELPARTLIRNLLDPRPKPKLTVVGGEPAPARRAA
jgi:peptidoglycan/LPS O-acetylase OafA/YrhL